MPRIELIRPLYLVKEHDIIRFMNDNNARRRSHCGCNLTCKTGDPRRGRDQAIGSSEWKKTHPDLDILDLPGRGERRTAQRARLLSCRMGRSVHCS
ncbi:MAG: hypothetical protein MZU84_07255 [Sphingobacterium sp.]|nr:hypothetical protein [Sphingobacterium sp.]